MDWLNWRNIVTVIIGGALAGVTVALYEGYQNSKQNEIGAKLYEGQLAIFNNQTQKAQNLVKELPSPSRSYLELLLGDDFYKKQHWDRSIQYFSTARRDLKETDKGLVYLILEKEAYIRYLKGDYQGALNLLKEIDVNAPNFCSAEILKAQIFADKNDIQTAKGVLERVLNSCKDANTQIAAKWLLTKIETQKGKVK